MRRISSTSTWWYKRGLPIVWFGFLAFFGFVVAPIGIAQQQLPWPTIFIPIGMMVFGYFLNRALVWPLVDEVWLNGEEVVVRNGGDEDRFPVANIINVEASTMVHPERITLMLREPCRFGREIKFMPPTRWWRLSRHPLADELIRRINNLPP